MDSKNIKKALADTHEYFKSFWEYPKQLELKIFYQFILMQTYIKFRLSPQELSKVWTEINTDLYIDLGTKKYNLFVSIRDSRSKEFDTIFKDIDDSDYYKFGTMEKVTKEQSRLMFKFGSSVLSKVEECYPPISSDKSNDAPIWSREFELAEKTIRIIPLQMQSITGYSREDVESLLD
jgi:hypothetical protein